ncbi:DUF3597 domain-containing protein [Roseomonas sp. M0104]|uniref:DUF3597 domain-containing protein n=1 Tax=Teichococcus coralli TaxID=2545983 RepID=A0A845BR34_9PROT|nr:DUF3597 domain-containing protein [Pseudoroseomonas coralli]MXP65849.1 DUF3597 domain-containing protein [Pseudoroseomonas coralli]
MSVFGSIMSRIFGHGQAGAATPNGASPASGSGTGAAPAAPAGGTPSATDDAPKITTASAPGTEAGTATPVAPGAAPMPSGAGAATPAPGAAGQQSVDVEAVLTEMAEKNPQKLDWRRSIVDLMKLLGLDSSLDNRKELAKELNYSGDPNDSAAMNIWLHKQVMQKLAENGGKVPDSLKS